MKILLLEDEIMLRDSIAEYLESLRHLVEVVSDGEKAYYKIIDNEFDLLILDVNIPNIDGFTLFENLKLKQIYTPVIYITAMADIEDIERGFSLGCSDYLKKPFHLKELALRVQKVEKDNLLKKQNHIIFSKNYSYDKKNKIIFFDSTTQKITKKQLQIIDLLASNIGIIVGFDKFRTYVWNGEDIDNPTIRAEIHRLKNSLKDDFIINIRGLGYKIDKFID